MNNSTTIQNIRLYLISPSAMNPRKTFDEDALKELAENIGKQGLLQPITVRPATTPATLQAGTQLYEIVCGERRYRACSLLRMETIPCIVREMTDEEALDAMITENMQRRDVDPIEEAVAFNLLAGRGQTTKELALRFGKSEKYVRDRMRLSNLIQPLQRMLSKGRVPLAGACLLARLTDEQQKDFLEYVNDEYVEDGELVTGDVKDWLDDYFMVIRHAPFQDGNTLEEAWNPNGKLIRRCERCEFNTACQTCLFADMKTDEPQCTNSECFNRKTEVYYDWFIRQHASRITRNGQSIAAGDMVLIEGDLWNDDDKKRMAELKEKLTLQGYRIFNERQLPRSCWQGNNELKTLLETGKVIECIPLRSMALQRKLDIEYRYLASEVASTSVTNDSHFMVARLCERSASIEANANKKITKRAKEAFDKEAYISRTSQLESWELDIIAAIIFDMVPWTEQDLLIPGTRNTHATYEQVSKFFNERNYSWMRHAIASFVFKECKQSFLCEAARQFSPAASADIKAIRREAQKRIDSINEELHEMGYDENGNNL